jgi:hypothetical protein
MQVDIGSMGEHSREIISFLCWAIVGMGGLIWWLVKGWNAHNTETIQALTDQMTIQNEKMERFGERLAGIEASCRIIRTHEDNNG